jgi:hypothetical protein
MAMPPNTPWSQPRPLLARERADSTIPPLPADTWERQTVRRRHAVNLQWLGCDREVADLPRQPKQRARAVAGINFTGLRHDMSGPRPKAALENASFLIAACAVPECNPSAPAASLGSPKAEAFCTVDFSQLIKVNATGAASIMLVAWTSKPAIPARAAANTCTSSASFLGLGGCRKSVSIAVSSAASH